MVATGVAAGGIGAVVHALRHRTGQRGSLGRRGLRAFGGMMKVHQEDGAGKDQGRWSQKESRARDRIHGRRVAEVGEGAEP